MLGHLKAQIIVFWEVSILSYKKLGPINISKNNRWGFLVPLHSHQYCRFTSFLCARFTLVWGDNSLLFDSKFPKLIIWCRTCIKIPRGHLYVFPEEMSFVAFTHFWMHWLFFFLVRFISALYILNINILSAGQIFSPSLWGAFYSGHSFFCNE